MLKVSELRAREVVNVLDGRRLGYIGDMDIELESGRIRALVVPGQSKVLGLFGKDTEIYIPWDRVVKIGADVILVELDVSPELY